MTTSATRDTIPTGILLGAAALIAFSLLTVAGARWAGVGREAAPAVAAVDAVASRELLFRDRADGGVDVLDAGTREAVTVIAPGQDGFMRATMRGLARERRVHGVGAEQPFRLSLTREGRLVLTDPTTGHLVALDAFGHTNARAFARLLAPNGRG